MKPWVVVVCALAALVLTKDAAAQEDRWYMLMQLADVHDHAGNYAQAAILYRQAADQVEGSGSVRYPQALDGLANVLNEMGKYPEAERLYNKSLALVESAVGKDNKDYAIMTVNLGMHYGEVGQVVKAEKLIRGAIECLNRIADPDEVPLAQARNALAVVLMANKKYGEAEGHLLQGLEVFRKHPEPGNGRLAVALSNLGAIRRYQGRLSDAEQFFRESIAVVDAELSQDHPLLMRELNNLGVVEMSLGHPDAAESAFQRAISVAEHRRLTGHPTYASLLMNYADIEQKIGKKREAKALRTQAKSVFADSRRANGTGMTVDVSSFRSQR